MALTTTSIAAANELSAVLADINKWVDQVIGGTSTYPVGLTADNQGKTFKETLAVLNAKSTALSNTL